MCSKLCDGPADVLCISSPSLCHPGIGCCLLALDSLLLLLPLLLLVLHALFLERLAPFFVLWWLPSSTCSHDSMWCNSQSFADTWTLEFTAAWLVQFLGLDSRTRIQFLDSRTRIQSLGLDSRTLEVTAAGTDCIAAWSKLFWCPRPWSFG